MKAVEALWRTTERTDGAILAEDDLQLTATVVGDTGATYRPYVHLWAVCDGRRARAYRWTSIPMADS